MCSWCAAHPGLPSHGSQADDQDIARTGATRLSFSPVDGRWDAGSLSCQPYSANSGDDTVYGNSGNDKLYRGPGRDTLSGGPGTDAIRQD
ncbi:hypothetical protein J7F01_33340 [Streptomyces sp. ISL-22]|nr:hypothetical protein [Streptomyces sp. ISL-24]MBT2436955.1 hypothetical protein [Streptomyces sp. ISL-22]